MRFVPPGSWLQASRDFKPNQSGERVSRLFGFSYLNFSPIFSAAERRSPFIHFGSGRKAGDEAAAAAKRDVTFADLEGENIPTARKSPESGTPSRVSAAVNRRR